MVSVTGRADNRINFVKIQPASSERPSSLWHSTIVNSLLPIHSFTEEAVSHPSEVIALAATSAALRQPQHLPYRAAESVVSETNPVSPESSADIALFVIYDL
jgi:hypothetical protein